MEALMVKCVENSISQFVHNNAIFLCERLCAEFPSEVNLQLLARCYLNNNQAYCAYHILKGTKMAESRYLFAISCFKMDLLSEAEAALFPLNDHNAQVPNGAAGHYLLGLIYRYTDRRKNSVEQFREALSIDPLLWAAYEELCILGAAEEASAIFSEAAVACVQQQHEGHESTYLSTSSLNPNSGSDRSFDLVDSNLRHLKHMQGNALKDTCGNHYEAASLAGSAGQTISVGLSNVSLCNTPSPMPTQLSGVAPPPLCRNVQPNPSALGGEGSLESVSRAPRRKFVGEGKSRKVPGSLFSDSGPRRSARLAAVAAARANLKTSPVAGNGISHLCAKYVEGLSSSSNSNSSSFHSLIVHKGHSFDCESFLEGKLPETLDDAHSDNTATTSSSTSSLADNRFQECEMKILKPSGIMTSSATVSTDVSDMLGLLRILGEGYRLLCMYRCQDALDTYQMLSLKQYNTGWVLSQVGKAYFELVDYLEADRAFSLARQVSPYNLEGMDIYSTVLYHLKEEKKLSYLALELISIDRFAPQSCCALGNCYSLQRDHETALKCFWRAVKMNPRSAYAHNLCGHECSEMEDFENGIKCFQRALRSDARHYNSWYGLGMVYLRQEKFEFAEHHFRKALQINSQSSVIMCYIGITLNALKRTEEALKMMEKAILADKKNPLPRYQKGKILAYLGNFDEALEVLEELKHYAPHESSIYALMGKIYKQLKMYDKAMLYYGSALDLKPSASDVAAIKCSIERLIVPDEIEDNL